jgi:outer membrane protein OmpA-like peptidoglycan-associated protein
MKKKIRYSVLLWLILCFPVIVFADGGVGLPFLKMGVGPRQAGMGGVFTGIGDDIYTLYWNPGGLGHIRQWQWSVDYNKWFEDIYQASATFAQQYRILGSRKTGLGISCRYLGMPEWDATGGEKEPVSVHHLVAGVTLAQRLDWLSSSLALGVTGKYIDSQLASYSAHAFAADIGLLFRPKRFELGSWGVGLFNYGIFSCGASILHLGTGMKFDKESSSLPRTLRSGLSFRMGRYDGWSWLLGFEWSKVRDSESIFGYGTEIWWRDLLGLRFGYEDNGENLGDFSFGLGFRWGDVINSLLGLPTRYGDAFQVDLAEVGYGDVLQQTYRGAVSHYSVAPEPFLLEEPIELDSGKVITTSAILKWEDTFDPDPFDEVSYILVIDKEKDKIEKSIHAMERDLNAFLSSPLCESLLLCSRVLGTQYTVTAKEGGVYHWAVAAHDLDNHARLAKKGKEQMGQFVVATPDLRVDEIAFTPAFWITTTPEQGILRFRVYSDGTGTAEKFHFIVLDSLADGLATESMPGDTLLETWISGLKVKEDTLIQIPWNTPLPGLHCIQTILDPEKLIFELDEGNNVRSEFFETVPKGRLIVPDSVEVIATGMDSTQIPVVPKIYFPAHSNEIDTMYIADGPVFPSILNTLVIRLGENPDVTLHIAGSIDALSQEKDEALADERAEAVKTKLVELGVSADRIVIEKNHPDKVLGKRSMPKNPQDAEWIMQENRVVGFSVSQKMEEVIFKPYTIVVDTTLKENVIPFQTRVVSPAGVETYEVQVRPGSIKFKDRQTGLGDSLFVEHVWDATDSSGAIVHRNYWYDYELSLKDTLDRFFKTHTDSIYLSQRKIIRRQEIFGAAKFGQVEPVYRFYWDRLMDVAREMLENPGFRLRFEGHACAIGSTNINERLSFQRAQRFTVAFLERVKAAFPKHYEVIKSRIDPPVGYGEREPLSMRLKGRGSMLIGDNNLPVGRYLNRRIMVLLYRVQ